MHLRCPYCHQSSKLGDVWPGYPCFSKRVLLAKFPGTRVNEHPFLTALDLPYYDLGGVRVGLGHRFAAAWVRVRAAFGDG